MPEAETRAQFKGLQQPHVGRKRGTGHATRLYTPAPAAYSGIDAYTHPNSGSAVSLDGRSQRATSLIMCQPGLPEGLSNEEGRVHERRVGVGQRP